MPFYGMTVPAVAESSYGSVWHHDPTKPVTRLKDFTSRASRPVESDPLKGI
jgi:hypothetical protein